MPQDNNPEWKKKLHNEAQSNYEDVSKSRKSSWIWGIALIFALVILVVLFWGIRARWEDISAQAQSGNNPSSQVSFATTISEVGDAVEKFSTAANVLELEPETEESPEANETEAMTDQLTDTPTENLISACADHDEVEFIVIDGPVLTPDEGFYHTKGLPTPEVYATWSVENTGNCNWESISFLSLIDGRIIDPVIKKDGEELDLQATAGKSPIIPGDQIEIVVPYEVTQALNVDDEFVVMINGIPLVGHPRAIIQVDRWVIVVQAQSDSTPDPDDTSPTRDNSGGGNQSGGSGQPPRPTPTPPR